MNQDHAKKLPISRGRYQLIPVLSELFAKRSFSGHKLDQTLRENHFTDQDRALFTELFYGFLRHGHTLLYLVDKFLSNPEKMPDKAKWILAIAFYQKLHLSKIPDHALVNEAVEMTKRFVGEEPFPKIVNAILHKFLQNLNLFKNLDDAPLWVQTSFAQWMADRLSAQWTPIRFFHLAQALNARSPTFIRVNIIKISEEKLMMKLANADIACHQTGLSNCLVLQDLNVSPKNVPGYHEGLWTIQNMASQRIVPFLDLHEGQKILDACAGFGGKTLQIAELLKDKAEIHYYDIVDKKMHAVQLRTQQMNFRHVHNKSEFTQIYDRVLVDAPCSGLGTIASHPEIKWFRSAKDLDEQNQKQMEVLQTYSQFVVPGGKLLYAVCSIDKTEGRDIIKAFLQSNPSFILDNTFKTSFEDDEFGTTILPTEKGESGYFVSRLIRL